MTPILPGRVHVVHSPDQSLCAKFNTHAEAPRQVLMRTTSLAHRDANGKFIPSVYGYGTMRSYDECASWLSADSQYCLLDEPYQPPSKKAKAVEEEQEAAVVEDEAVEMEEPEQPEAVVATGGEEAGVMDERALDPPAFMAASAEETAEDEAWLRGGFEDDLW